MHLKKFKYAFICFVMVLLLALPSSTFIMRYAFAEDTDDNTISDPVVIDQTDDLPDPNDDPNPDVIAVDDDEELVITEESGKSGDVSAVAEKSVNVGLIVGVSVGAAAAVIAVVVIVLVVRSKNKVKPKKRKRRR